MTINKNAGEGNVGIGGDPNSASAKFQVIFITGGNFIVIALCICAFTANEIIKDSMVSIFFINIYFTKRAAK